MAVPTGTRPRNQAPPGQPHEHLRTDGASQLPEVGLQLAATQLTQFFLQPDAQQQLAASPENYTRVAAILCRIAGQIQSLQKYRDDSAKELDRKLNPERIKRDEQSDVEETRAFSAPQKCRSVPAILSSQAAITCPKTRELQKSRATNI